MGLWSGEQVPRTHNVKDALISDLEHSEVGS